MTGLLKGNVLITRPFEDAQRIGDLVNAKNYSPYYVPFLNVVLHKKDMSALDGYGGLIFTSRNGVRAFCANSDNRTLPALVVGDATKHMALEYGFKDVQSAQGNVEALKDLILKNVSDKPYLYVRGQEITQDLDGYNVVSKILYHTDMNKKIDDKLCQDIGAGGFDYAMFFSNRTAQAFVAYVQENELCEGLKETKALCLGASMVKSVSVLPWKSTEVAVKPEAISVIDL